ncbi:MAG: NADH-quinone oxidoreductase subunit N [Acidimicrobiaceae bacterium TMED130]|nr:MAG: NADH-quinone oxidoreductase subunit N [Acidimicrobiaceae bacterium TMED130]|tara:strand:+ start:18261 stop:19793 length:1533 start_codon:yes stop_codon:yes gene_type:complete
MLITASIFGNLLASTSEFIRPPIDWHAVAPELCLLGGGAMITLIDVIWREKGRAITSALAGLFLLAPLIPILTLAIDSEDRSMFNGAFIVDKYSLIVKAIFLLSGYLVVLLSTNYIAEGEYWENEYYGMLLSSILGMVVMASARDLITIFVALELLSIPAYMLATWRKRDLKSNEAGLKYYLMGVFASAIMLYGMSLIFGVSGSTILVDINAAISSGESSTSIITLGVIFVIIGFAFKVSAFPFHTWAPDTYEGAPTPVTAFLAVASKAAGFVALMNLVVVGFFGRGDVFQPLLWILAALSMTAGNVMALRQTNLIRLMAYSGIAQAGFMLAPLAVAGESIDIADKSVSAVVTYLAIYASMNLGAFAIILSVSRTTGTGQIESYNGLFKTAPGLAIMMTIFLASLAGVPPLGGWFAKFSVFTSLTSADTGWGYALAVIAAVNAVIAFGYYGRIAMKMWVEEPHQSHTSEMKIPVSLSTALAITVATTLAFGVVPGIVTHFTDVSLTAFAM